VEDFEKRQEKLSAEWDFPGFQAELRIQVPGKNFRCVGMKASLD
jgi:hypothetical protein